MTKKEMIEALDYRIKMASCAIDLGDSINPPQENEFATCLEDVEHLERNEYRWKMQRFMNDCKIAKRRLAMDQDLGEYAYTLKLTPEEISAGKFD